MIQSNYLRNPTGTGWMACRMMRAWICGESVTLEAEWCLLLVALRDVLGSWLNKLNGVTKTVTISTASFANMVIIYLYLRFV